MGWHKFESVPSEILNVSYEFRSINFSADDFFLVSFLPNRFASLISSRFLWSNHRKTQIEITSVHANLGLGSVPSSCSKIGSPDTSLLTIFFSQTLVFFSCLRLRKCTSLGMAVILLLANPPALQRLSSRLLTHPEPALKITETNNISTLSPLTDRGQERERKWSAKLPKDKLQTSETQRESRSRIARIFLPVSALPALSLPFPCALPFLCPDRKITASVLRPGSRWTSIRKKLCK